MRCTGIWHSEIIWKRASHLRRFPVCFQSVKRTIYRRMERCWLRALNSSNISDDELDQNVTETAKDENKCWNFFTKKEASKECHDNWFQTSDLRLRKLRPSLQTRLNSYHLMFYGHAMFKENSQKESKYLSSPVYRCRPVASIKQWKPNKV